MFVVTLEGYLMFLIIKRGK